MSSPQVSPAVADPANVNTAAANAVKYQGALPFFIDPSSDRKGALFWRDVPRRVQTSRRFAKFVYDLSPANQNESRAALEPTRLAGSKPPIVTVGRKMFKWEKRWFAVQ
jgi:hypothetical protein